jgi:catechol 2,3-dioxygenase-like lactoylglutathione lyase family enzyme
MTSLSCFAIVSGLALAVSANTSILETQPDEETPMQLGNFSVSLAVKDIETSRAFYEKLDFKKVGGDPAQNWLILQNGTTTIGLFQGMFDNNIMTFNPGWDKDQNTLDGFQDVRELQRTLKERGVVPITEADEKTTGPASFVIVDPDGNTVFFDQHVDSPE